MGPRAGGPGLGCPDWGALGRGARTGGGHEQRISSRGGGRLGGVQNNGYYETYFEMTQIRVIPVPRAAVVYGRQLKKE